LTATAWWELISPLPLPGETASDPSPRIKIARQAADELHATWPEMVSMHPVDPMAADEEIVLMDRAFVSLMYAQYFHLPSYMGWMRAQDHTPVYEHLITWLKVLQHQSPARKGKKWILKSPQHLLGGGLRTAMAAFPNAKAIMTHRRLENVVTSYCSMHETLGPVGSPAMDMKSIGPEWIGHFQAAIKDLVDIRSGPAGGRFIDVQYKQTVSEPIAQFRRVMEEMGLTVTDEDTRAADKWMSDNRRENHPPHHYSAEDYGMTNEQLAEIFRDYHERFVR